MLTNIQIDRLQELYKLFSSTPFDFDNSKNHSEWLHEFSQLIKERKNESWGNYWQMLDISNQRIGVKNSEINNAHSLPEEGDIYSVGYVSAKNIMKDFLDYETGKNTEKPEA